MFGKSRRERELEEALDSLRRSTAEMSQNHRLEIESLKHAQELALKDKEFELKHFKDAEIKKANDTIVELRQKVAVLEKENKMLDKIVDVNTGLVDVKSLVKSLIEKLPSIDLKSLTISGTK